MSKKMILIMESNENQFYKNVIKIVFTMSFIVV